MRRHSLNLIKKKKNNNYMSSKFTVIESTNEDKLQEMDRISKIAKLNEIWERQLYKSIESVLVNGGRAIQDLSQAELTKIGLSGVKYICSLRDVKRENVNIGTGYTESLDDNRAKFQMIDFIFSVLGCLTLKNFVTTFPIEKYYKGAKWEEKDYFYTMEVLKDMDWDRSIGRDKLSELLWDYENDELRHVYIEFTTAMSAIYRAQTGKGIAETWCDNMGIPTYTEDKETGIMKNNRTGDIMKPKKASHIQIVK